VATAANHASLLRRRVAAATAIALTLAACSTAPTPRPADPDAIVVGSFNFAESELVAELYAQVLQDAGFTVTRVPRIGTRELVEPALQRGLLDLVPEYAGSLLDFLSDGEKAAHDIDRVMERLSVELDARELVALEPARAQNQNALALSPARARLGYDAVSDLTGVASAWTIGGPPECPQRPLCLPGFESVYGLRFKEFVPLDTAGPLTFEALRTGAVDVAVVFTTEGRLVNDELVLLRDDLHLQPTDNITPVVRRDVLDRLGPEMAERINAVSAALTTEELRILNLRLAEGAGVHALATNWLADHGLIAPVG
jgi:osmoprotectant transport system substrate-binding protein